jgi:alpha-tubulin suppressor-like RCC1 family protein
VLAVAADGRVWAWGKNEVGQLGLGSGSAWQATPSDITAALDGAWKVGALFDTLPESNHIALAQQAVRRWVRLLT